MGALAAALLAVAAVEGGLAVMGAWRAGRLTPVMTSTLTITAMIFATIRTASMFALVFRGLGGDEHVEAVLAAMPGGPDGALLFVMALIFLLGCRSEEHTSELQSLMRISYAVFCLKKKNEVLSYI